MRHATAAALSLFLVIPPLSACAQLSTVTAATTGSVSTVIPEAMNVAKRGLTAAHLAHQAAADWLTIAANSNFCIRQCAVDAKKYLDQSEAALVAGDKLIALGDARGIEDKITAATAFMSQARSVVGGH